MKLLLVLITVIAITGCASYSSPIPENYTGDVAIINDSFSITGNNAQIFYVKKIDGKEIKNAFTETTRASYGKGRKIVSQPVSRNIPARELNIRLTGETYYSAPIDYLVRGNTTRRIDREITFTPLKNEHYVVKGLLSEDKSSIWIENSKGETASEILSEGTNPVSTKVQKKGSLQPKTIQELFLNLAIGESEKMVIEKLGKPTKIAFHKENTHAKSLENTTYDYKSLGLIRFHKTGEGELYIHEVVSFIDTFDDVEITLLLLEQSSQKVRESAKKTLRNPPDNEEVLDLIAEKIWLNCVSRDKDTLDAMAWLSKIIGQSKNPRYRQVLTETKEKTQDGKLKRYLDSSLSTISVDDIEQFVPRPKLKR